MDQLLINALETAERTIGNMEDTIGELPIAIECGDYSRLNTIEFVAFWAKAANNDLAHILKLINLGVN